MRVLVTGGAGFIGSHVVRALAERGDTVRVLDNFSSGKRAHLAGVEIELINGDVRNPDIVCRAIAGMTHVIHLAAFVSVPGSVADPLACDAVNVVGTLNVLMAAGNLGIQRVVFASSTAVYGGGIDGPKHEDLPLCPLSPYGVAKLAAEKYCSMFYTVYGLETVVLRYFNVFGPRQDPHSEYAAVVPRFISALLHGRRPVIYGDGEQSRDFIYVSNVVEANLLALTAPGAAGQAFNVAGGEAVSINRLVQMLAQVAGTALEPEHVAPRSGDIRHSSADMSKAKAVLGFNPTLSLREGLELTLRWYQEHPDAQA